MKQLFLAILFFIVIAGNLVQKAQAIANQTPKQIGHFGQWTAYVMTENQQQVCYMVSLPVSSKGNYKKRGQVYAMVTHRPSEKSYNIASFHAGYKFSSGAKVKVRLGTQEFTLFTAGETAWTSDSSEDHALVAAINKESTMTVFGTSSRGTKTEDIYSLTGSSRALAAISQACSVK